MPCRYGLTSVAEMAPVVRLELLREVNALMGLSHPNVVRLACVGAQPVALLGPPTLLPRFVAMELCREGTLRDWIDSGKVSDVVAAFFAADLVAGMAYVLVLLAGIARMPPSLDAWT
jgi:serine/threonine protein kinase